MTLGEEGAGSAQISLPVGSVVAYLGPEGTFTHQAARSWAGTGVDLVPVRTVTDVYEGIASGTMTHGVVAIENSVEGYVVPSLDAIVAARDVVAIDETFVAITFDAFSLPTDDGPFTQATSHPHGLAQCQGFVAERDLRTVASTSNAAACRDLTAGQLGLAPRLCGELYGLRTRQESVEDFHGARTRFLLLTSRNRALAGRWDEEHQAWRTMLAVTPHLTGPGVLARITEAFGRPGVNMSSLITRPLKALEARYVFILTVDGAPWAAELRGVLATLLDAGDSVKTLGVFPLRGELDAAVDVDRVPAGSVQLTSDDETRRRGLLWS